MARNPIQLHPSVRLVHTAENVVRIPNPECAAIVVVLTLPESTILLHHRDQKLNNETQVRNVNIKNHLLKHLRVSTHPFALDTGSARDDVECVEYPSP